MNPPSFLQSFGRISRRSGLYLSDGGALPRHLKFGNIIEIMVHSLRTFWPEFRRCLDCFAVLPPKSPADQADGITTNQGQFLFWVRSWCTLFASRVRVPPVRA